MTDADLGGLAETRQSTTGIMVYADGVPVYWKSKTEKTVFWSTAASEYVGFSKGNAVAKWLNSILEFYLKKGSHQPKGQGSLRTKLQLV